MKWSQFKAITLFACVSILTTPFASAAGSDIPPRQLCAEMNEVYSEYDFPLDLDGFTLQKIEARWERGQCVIEKTQTMHVVREAKNTREQLYRDAGFEASNEDIINMWLGWEEQGVIGQYMIEAATSPFGSERGQVIIHFQPDRYLQPFTATKQF